MHSVPRKPVPDTVVTREIEKFFNIFDCSGKSGTALSYEV